MKPMRSWLAKCLLPITLILGLMACGNAQRIVCKAPPWPAAPAVATTRDACPAGLVCYTDEAARALGLWYRDLSRYRQAAEACK